MAPHLYVNLPECKQESDVVFLWIVRNKLMKVYFDIRLAELGPTKLYGLTKRNSIQN